MKKNPPESETGETPDRTSRRGEILEQATALFLEKGYAGTSMNALAQVCGIQKASLYHHFPGKEALFVACVTEGYDVAIRQLQQILDDPDLTHETRIRAMFAALYRITIESPAGRMSPLIAEVSRQIPEVAEAFHEGFIRRQHEIVNAMIDRGVEDGTFRPQDPLGMEHLIFGPIVTLSISRQMFAELDALETHFPVTRVRDSHCDLVLQLLRKDAGAAN